MTNEYQIGIKLWKKNATDGTLDREWFVSQASKALMISNDAVRPNSIRHRNLTAYESFVQVVLLNAREDFFNVNIEDFKVPTEDQGASDRGLIVTFMVAREVREMVYENLRLLGHRLVLRVST